MFSFVVVFECFVESSSRVVLSEVLNYDVIKPERLTLEFVKKFLCCPCARNDCDEDTFLF